MKVVWIVNFLLPDVCEKLDLPKPVLGGWIYSQLKAINESNNSIELFVIAPFKCGKVESYHLNNVTYILIPCTNNMIYQEKLEHQFKKISDTINPDFVHIHGTEYPFSLAYINACPNVKYAVSLQGLLSNYVKYYYGGIKFRKLIFNTSIRDIARNDTIFDQKKRMLKRSIYEKEILKKSKYVLGYTFYDKSITYAINSELKYFKINDILRDEFYNNFWVHENCIPYSIFISQGHYPIKGLHKMILALPTIIKRFPKTMLYVSGVKIIFKYAWNINAYSNYINELIYKLKLENNINFVGVLNPSQMCEQFLKANVYVNPSCIENSPNSVCEAQLLGVPCVASNVGGTDDLITNGVNGYLYRFEEDEILALRIIDFFSDLDNTRRISNNARELALVRHNKINNTKNILSIYNDILND